MLLIAFITTNARWYPQTHHYAGYVRDYPFILRATQHMGFQKLATVTGIDDAVLLRAETQAGIKRPEVGKWYNVHFNRNFREARNMDKLNNLK